ncbi:MAG: porin [Rickettsiaceae bacterium]|nr:porin [Rickettsiaceae bacterium]
MEIKKYLFATAISTIIVGTISAEAAIKIIDGTTQIIEEEVNPTEFSDMTPKSDEDPTGVNIKFNAFAHFQAGYRNQRHLTQEEKAASTHKRNLALFDEAAIVAQISNKTDADLEYGAKIVIVTTAKRKASNAYNGTHLFISTEYGKLELGAPISPSSTMMISSGDITAGTNKWDRYANITSEYQKQEGLNPTFVTTSEFFMSDKYTAHLDNRSYSTEPSRAIVYYTPKFNLNNKTKFTIGLAYTPDSSNTGADNINKLGTGIETKKIGIPGVDRFEFEMSVKDALAAGITIEHNISDGVDLKIGLTGEMGKSKGTAKLFENAADTTPVAEYKLANLRAYNIGAVLNYGNFYYAASYGSLGKSLTTPEYHKTGRKTDYYTAAIAYNQGPFKVSASYFKSDKFKNTAEAWTLASDYKAAPGLKPYVEITKYKLNGRPEFYNTLAKKKVTGTALIAGIKLAI